MFQFVKTFSCTVPYWRLVGVPMNTPNQHVVENHLVKKTKHTASRGAARGYWLPRGTDQQQQGAAEPEWTHKLSPISWPAVAPHISSPRLYSKSVILSPRGSKVKLGVLPQYQSMIKAGLQLAHRVKWRVVSHRGTASSREACAQRSVLVVEYYLT